MNIQIKKLMKEFDREPILRGIDLDFPLGKRLALVGANGSGKSTLLRAMMGMISYTGEINFFDPDKGHLSPFQVMKKIAYVPQISPYFSTPVSDVVNTVLQLRGSDRDHFIKYLQQLRLDYREVSRLPFRKLSGGMKQKLLIALAFSSDPQVLLLDEPTASLDPESREIFYSLGKQFSNSSLLLCSHRLEEIQHLVDEVVVLDKGLVTFQGKTQIYLRRFLNEKKI